MDEKQFEIVIAAILLTTKFLEDPDQNNLPMAIIEARDLIHLSQKSTKELDDINSKEKPYYP